METKTQEQKINEILGSVRKTEKYMKWTLWITVVVFVLPAVLLIFTLPTIISSYSSTINSLGVM